MVMTFGTLDHVIDNTGSFPGSVLPDGGSVIHFGEHRIFIATVSEFPAEVHACSDRLPVEMAGHESGAGLRNYVECMVTHNSGEHPEASRTATARSTASTVPGWSA